MASTKRTQITASIATILPREEIETLARELGVVTRQRKVQVFALVTVLTMAYQSGTTRTIAAMRETYEKLTNTPLTRNAFYKRGDRRRSLAESVSDSAVYEGFGGIVAQIGVSGAGAAGQR